MAVRLGVGAPHTEFQLPNLQTKTMSSYPLPGIQHALPLNLSSLLYKSQHFMFTSALWWCLTSAAVPYQRNTTHKYFPRHTTHPSVNWHHSQPKPSVRIASCHQSHTATTLPSPIIFSPPNPSAGVYHQWQSQLTQHHSHVLPQCTRSARVPINSTLTPNPSVCIASHHHHRTAPKLPFSSLTYCTTGSSGTPLYMNLELHQ